MIDAIDTLGARIPLTLAKGVDAVIACTLTDEDTNTPVDLTDAVFTVQIVNALDKSLAATLAGTVTDGPAGEHALTITSASIATLSERGKYEWFCTYTKDALTNSLYWGPVTIVHKVGT